MPNGAYSMIEVQKLWDKAVQAADDRRYISGRLGKADASGLVTMIVTGRPNHLYVSLGPEGDQGVTIAMNIGAPRIPWVPIRLKRENNQLTIEGLDYTPGRLEAFFAGQTAPGNVGFHDHRIGSGLEYELEALRFEVGRVYPVSGLTVGVKAFRYYYHGAWDTWEAGSTIDLTSYKPASGKWAWVLVGVNPSANALVAAKGADQDAQADLTVALIDSISFGDYIPCAAVQLAEADTAVASLSRWHDAHGWVNMAIDELGDLTDVTVSSPAENDAFWYDGTGWVNGQGHRLNVDEAQALTIVSGALSVDATDAQHGLIDVRGESSTDDLLATITGGNNGDVVFLIVADPSTYGEITVDNSGNINVVGEIVLDDTGDCLVLVKTAAGWNPIGGAYSAGVSVGEALVLNISAATTSLAAAYNEGLIDIRPVTPGSDDTLATINGGSEGQIIVLYVSDPSTYGAVTVSNSGNINVDDDIVLDTAGDAVALVYTDVGWCRIGGAAWSSSLSDLGDATIDGTPADNEVLAYDTTSSEFVNQTAAEAGLATADHNHDGERQNIGSPQAVTIASGEADISSYATKPYFDIRGEGAAADDLDTLTETNSANGDIIYLTATVETITVKNATDNILLSGGADRTLDPGYTLVLRYNGADWIEVSYTSLGT